MLEEFRFEKKLSRLERRDGVSEKFLDFYEKEGFDVVKNSDLLIPNDPTLLFANSTMCRYKDIIREQTIPGNGIAIDQLCLRSKNLDKYFDGESDLTSPTLFRMVGTIVSAEMGMSILATTKEFLAKELSITNERLYIKTSSNCCPELNEIIETNDMNVLYDTEDQKYYNWKYGEDKVVGSGVTFSLMQSNNKLTDIGNFIAFISNGEVIGYETAFGLERLISSSEGRNKFFYYDICDVIEYRDDKNFRKILGALTCAVELINQGVIIGAKKQGYILRKYIQAISYLSNKLDSFDLEGLISNYVLHKKYSLNITNTVRKYIDEIKLSRLENIEDFRRFCKKNSNLSSDELIGIGKKSFSLDKNDVESIFY